jgi:hypothetical protein
VSGGRTLCLLGLRTSLGNRPLTFPTNAEHFSTLVHGSHFHRAIRPQWPSPPRNPPVADAARRPPAPTLPCHHGHPPLRPIPCRAHPNPTPHPNSPRLSRLWCSSRHHHPGATKRRSPPVRLRLGCMLGCCSQRSLDPSLLASAVPH